MSKPWLAFLLSAILVCPVVLSSCARTKVVGISEGAGEMGPAASDKVKHPTAIAIARGESLGLNNPILGDVDGDGYDDFLLHTALGTFSFNAGTPPSRIYLFYGRAEFPERLDTDDADVVFQATGDPLALGDVNGDGLADFALTHADTASYEIVLGRRVRLEGEREAHSSGVVWKGEKLPPPFSQALQTLSSVQSAGDVNCDGIDDVLVASSHIVGDSEQGRQIGAFGLVEEPYLVLGRAELPSGAWDPAWAAATFGLPNPEGLEPWQVGNLYPMSYGDLDGDGCDDIGAVSESGMQVFYGRELGDGLTRLVPDAGIRITPVFAAFPIGDLDGDGATDQMAGPGPERTFGVVYGSKQRWTGDVQLSPEFLLQLEPTLDSSWTFSAAVGDIDGDALPELLVGMGTYGLQIREERVAARGAMYVVRGMGQRALGMHELTDADLLAIGPEQDLTSAPRSATEATAAGLGSSLSVAGDVDGDGGSDILTAAPSVGEAGTVYLLPSGPRPPD